MMSGTIVSVARFLSDNNKKAQKKKKNQKNNLFEFTIEQVTMMKIL